MNDWILLPRSFHGVDCLRIGSSKSILPVPASD
jgi:hypothetical protein